MIGQRQSPSGGHIVIVAVFAMVVALSGLMTVPPLDRDESRFIQATTQMIESGDYVRIRYQDTERNKKPVGIYWLQAAAVNSLADVEDRPLWAYRMPSLLGVTLACVFTYLAGCSLFGRQAAFIGAMLLAAAPVLAGEGSIAKTDAALLGAVAGMQAALARLVTARAHEKTWRIGVLFWAAMGIGILLKGPIAPMIAAFTVGSLVLASRVQGDPFPYRRLLPLSGPLVLVALIAPWAIAIGIATDGRFFTDAIGTDMLGKISESQEDHDGPPGYHLVVLFLMFWPAGLFLPSALRGAVGAWREPGIVFALGWLVPAWIVFELTSTKLPHYPMVLYPAIALLVGRWIARGARPDPLWARLFGVLGFLVVGAVAATVVVFLADLFSSRGVQFWHIGAAALIGGVSLAAGLMRLAGRTVSALMLAAFASGAFAWVAFEGVLPTLDRLQLTPRLAAMLDEHEAHPLRDDKELAIVGYHEPSAVFTLGTATALLDAKEAARWITAAPGRNVVVEAAEEREFLENLPEGSNPVMVSSIEGFNYSNNRDMRLSLYRLRPSLPPNP